MKFDTRITLLGLIIAFATLIATIRQCQIAESQSSTSKPYTENPSMENTVENLKTLDLENEKVKNSYDLIILSDSYRCMSEVKITNLQGDLLQPRKMGGTRRIYKIEEEVIIIKSDNQTDTIEVKFDQTYIVQNCF